MTKAFPNEKIQLGTSSKQSKQLLKNWCFLDKSKKCEACWKKNMLENVIPLIADQSERDFWNNALSGQTKASKKKQVCKWCKSTTHKTKRSKKCPFNKNNVAAVSAAVTPTTAVSPVTPITAVSPVTIVADTDNDSSTNSTANVSVANDVVSTVFDEDVSAKFRVGDNVYCKWKRKEWYLAHITAANPTSYDVYFPDDGKTKKNVPFKDVREPDSFVKAYHRGDLIGRTFYCDGDVDLAPGEWKVRKIGEGNTYTWVRMTGGGRNPKNCEEFDIGYVIREIVRQEQILREN